MTGTTPAGTGADLISDQDQVTFLRAPVPVSLPEPGQAPSTEVEQLRALAIAQDWIRQGIPVFIAPPDPMNKVGFRLPEAWQTSTPRLEVLDDWRPGWALCAVMGHGLDLLDVDDRNGGAASRDGLVAAGLWPRAVGVASTPSGGGHYFVASMGVRSRDGVLPGLDVKAGVDGLGHGFAFIAPTVRVSKVTGELVAYRWTTEPDLGALAEESEVAAMAALVRDTKASRVPVVKRGTARARLDQLPEIIRVGERDAVLFKYACSLRGRDVPYKEAACYMAVAVERCEQAPGDPFRGVDALAKLDHVYETYAPNAVARGAGPRPDEHHRDDLELDVAELEGGGELQVGRLASVPLGRRMAAEMLLGRYIHVPSIGWHRWDGVRWAECKLDHVMVDAADWAEQFITGLVRSGADIREVKQALRYREVGGVKQLVDGAKTTGSAVLVDATRLDAHPWLLNCPNGVIDLATGDLTPHDPGLLITKVTSVDYAPGARHADWDAALEAFADAETTRWCQQYLGTGCTGVPPSEDVVPFWHGGGSNGKSTILGGVQASLGEYAMALSKTLLGGRREEHPTQMMDLRGLRLGFMEETAEGHRLDTVKLKEIVGTDVIKGRRMRQDYVSFISSHTLVITTNYRPVVNDTDHGTWRRLRMVPFPNKYGDDGQPIDLGLRARIRTGPEQQKAALAWLVAGAVHWYTAGSVLPPEPTAITEATREWRAGSDLIFAFAQDRLVADPIEYEEVEDVRAAFNEWLPKPHREWGRQTFSERFSDHPALRELGVARGLHPKTRRAVFFGVQLL